MGRGNSWSTGLGVGKIELNLGPQGGGGETERQIAQVVESMKCQSDRGLGTSTSEQEGATAGR